MPDTIAQHSDSPSPRRRASTHDREATAAILRVAMTDGMLTVTEFDERSAAAYAAASVSYTHLTLPTTPYV